MFWLLKEPVPCGPLFVLANLVGSLSILGWRLVPFVEDGAA